jgi:PAS domain S-box-containing protein
VTQETTPRRTGRFAQAAAEEFRLLVESVKDYAIFLLDRDGYVMSWNAGAERIKGYAAEEILGEHFSRFYEPENQTAGVPARRWRRRRGRAASTGAAGASASTAAAFLPT